MPDPQWIEDRFWIWVHSAAPRLGRGELFEVIDFLSYLRSQALGPLALVSHGQLPGACAGWRRWPGPTCRTSSAPCPRTTAPPAAA